ncbi:HNH endonuclease [Mesorhizobium sp. BH1-1-4]|uniref:HNH endonuclease n=1 Tax=Mesorhizobium sp. BH1-1-4 TaxID=2876662 RepID=UPI001CD1475E|nr:HNH endonuclease [Mesorhizobium sp. BH1-1-4]MBZ9993150.1 HNH endonuclease [Mesorhizobium sp. BH1-1-4]
MSYGPTRIPTKGACIYCGKTGEALTDEHFLPLALGGQHILEDASCLACADITKKFEQDVARDMWGDARISYDAPSRRKKARPTHIRLRDPDNPNRQVRVAYRDYPAPLIFYKMNRAGFLEGLPETTDISGAWQFSAVMDDKKADDFERKFDIKLTAKFRHVPDSFGRLLAKIGYGQILCNLNPDDFRPICLPYILGLKKNLSYIVGGSFDIPPPNEGQGYILRTLAFGDLNRTILLAEIRLYANNHTPIYHVMVGDAVGEAATSAIWEKLGDVPASPMSLLHSTPDDRSKPPHWIPHAWPLPGQTIGRYF